MKPTPSLVIGSLAAAFGSALAAGPLDAQRKWPIPANDTVWVAPPNPVSRQIVTGWRSYIAQNWRAGAFDVCTSSHYDLIMDALDNDTYHRAAARAFTRNGIRGRANGEYLQGHNVIIANHRTTLGMQAETVAHEAMHRGGYTDNDPEPHIIARCITGASEDEDDDGGGGGSTGGITLSASDALACSTFEGEGGYCASLTIKVPQCWTGTVTIQDPNSGAALTVNTGDDDCDGKVTIESICEIPYDWWINFCW